MSWKLCKWQDEPERWAIFDTIVDRFIIWDATMSEIRAEYLAEERRRAVEAFERFANRPPGITKAKGLEIQRQVHGDRWLSDSSRGA